MKLCCIFKILVSFRCEILLYTFLGVCYDVADKSEFEWEMRLWKKSKV